MFLITFLSAFVLTGNTLASTGISIVANTIKTVTYFTYERIWSQIEWGK